MTDSTTAANEARIKRLRFRAWHRGTREADYMIGGFFDAYHAKWSDAELTWFETMIEEEDVDIMGWALGTLSIPAEYQGPMMEAFCRLDYVDVRNGPTGFEGR
ncbi:succinate dehydrogenase assembly factor 2 [Novosphingobium sp. FSY-8]|uniref:FAD assembly factor SdhE n=1 Tax=Novosphingobium ovatum TaxID=1908523 RepID=A0ABW9XA48_9SPHN|nr:succinate dehydrogenase assembly factor 2 [Novosphingobium ovatum]NBC35396.1 succinate dehydrogenase assembly factor 2 [Novosphingobium ovatum]